jgi:membrane dipeptidase
MTTKETEPVQSRVQDRFLCDAHIDTLSKMLKFGWKTLADIPADSHVTSARLRKSNVGVAVFAIFTEKYDRTLTPVARTLRMIDMAHSIAASNSDWLELAVNSKEIVQALKRGKIAMLLSIENGIAIGNDLGLLRNYHRLGIRMMSIAWNHRNPLGDGVGRFNARRGLTPFGREAIAEMERLGMLVDVSHLNEKTFWDVAEAARNPIVATHSNAKSVCGSPRNLNDSQIRAISANGGFIGLNFCSAFLNDSGEGAIDDIVKHAVHIASVGGIETLAIGSDFDGIENPPKGLEHIGKIGKLIAPLEKAGFSSSEIDAISHRNFLRVFRKVCG